MSSFLTSYAGVLANRLNGNVVIATPPSVGFYSACCISVLASSALFLCLATYTRHETVIGWLVPHGGLIQVDASAGGTLSKILVKEGAFVRAGAPIARVRLASTLSSGQNAGTAAREALSAEAAAIAADAAATEQKLLADAAEIGPKLADLKGEVRQDQQQVALQVQQIAIAREDLARFKRLAVGGDMGVPSNACAASPLRHTPLLINFHWPDRPKLDVGAIACVTPFTAADQRPFLH